MKAGRCIGAPYSGIFLSGSPGGTTPYEQVFLAPQDVSLSAQLRLFRGSVPYNFAYWKINGAPQQPRETDVQFRVEADTTVEAVYNILGDANGATGSAAILTTVGGET